MSMFRKTVFVRRGIAARAAFMSLAGALLLGASLPSQAQEVPASAEDAYQDMLATAGVVPGFAQMYPKEGIAGAWLLTRELLFKETSLDFKTKALISLAVSAQIPCQYCIWSDTRDALRAGATEEQVHEAVAIAGLTRHWSTIFNGYQIDFDTFKRELGGD
jgi:AhpD family alkylhydroperoxidase